MEVKEKQDIRLIKKLRVKNFKSFKDVEVELGNFNVVIGANASGKSNFVQIFKFLRDIVKEGLENAISYQGGIEYLRNISLGEKENLYIEFVSPIKGKKTFKLPDERIIGVKPAETTYSCSISSKGKKYAIAGEAISSKCRFVLVQEEEKEKGGKKRKTLVEKEEIGEGEIGVTHDAGKIDIEIVPKELQLMGEQIFPASLLGKLSRVKMFKDHLILETPFIFLFDIGLLPLLPSGLDDIAIYDFDPKLSKKAIPIAGKSELEEDGSNLAFVLKKILADKKNREQFLYLMRNLLPFINKLDVEKFADKSLLVKLQEAYYKEYLPATLISDGTINLTALILALYFEEKPLVIIEEPERNIHPHLISKVVEMMKEASQNKQIIVTTHNPEVVRYAVQDKELENLLLIYRDKEGFSHISRPADKIEVKTFLEQEIGIEELYVENLLTF
jgi:predicted ATPase